jgi:hypothetical protein
MRTCPRCGDLSDPLAVWCESCGCNLVPVKVALREIRALRMPGAKRGKLARCPYCGKRVRGYCSEHVGLERELYGASA